MICVPFRLINYMTFDLLKINKICIHTAVLLPLLLSCLCVYDSTVAMNIHLLHIDMFTYCRCFSMHA